MGEDIQKEIKELSPIQKKIMIKFGIVLIYGA